MENRILLGREVVITDPAYPYGEVYQKSTNRILPGWWRCAAKKVDCGDWGMRVKSILICHEDYVNKDSLFENIGLVSGRIAVDSGQCGFFDSEYFQKNQPDDDFDNPKSWYRRVCEITLNEPDYGTIDERGFVASSGYGDGMYEVWGEKNSDGLYINFIIIFIENEIEED